MNLEIVHGPFARQGFRETDDDALAGAIADGLQFGRRSTKARDGRNIDDLAAFLRNQDLAHGLREQKRSGQIGFDDFVPMLEAHLFDRRAPGSASIVDQDIDPAEFGDGCVYHLLDVAWVLHVATQCPGPYAELAQFLSRPFASLLLASTKHQMRAHLREAFGHLAPQSNGTS